MPDANAHPADMFTVTPDTLPRFWWLNPWLTCKRLHTACVALRELADAQAASIRHRDERDAIKDAEAEAAKKWKPVGFDDITYLTYNPQARRAEVLKEDWQKDRADLLTAEAALSAQKDANAELLRQVENHKHNHLQTVKLLHQVIAERQALEAKLKAKKKKGRRHA